MDLKDFFKTHSKLALAFSGGTDSAYLLYEAVQCGADVRAYYVKSVFQPEFEWQDAIRLAKQLGVSVSVIELDILEDETIQKNPVNRCYFCKKKIFSEIVERAKEDGYELLIDGTNASDDTEDRPGMRALEELSVRSPLREYGLTKGKIRILSREAGLFTWNKPAYACLATRIPSGRTITKEFLRKTECAEGILFAMGFRDFRIRLSGNLARVQLLSEQMEKGLKQRKEMIEKLKPYYDGVVLDLEGRDE